MTMQDVQDFLVEELQGHGFAHEIGDELADRARGGPKAEPLQQVKQLIEHLPPPDPADDAHLHAAAAGPTFV